MNEILAGKLPINDQESTEVSRIDPFRVFLPGATGGGKGITSIRDHLHEKYGEDVFIPSSISSRESVKKGENIDSHYTALAQEIFNRSNGRNVEIIAHSFGGFEVVDILNKFFALDNSHVLKRDISLNFISVPGFTSKGLETVADLVKALHVFEVSPQKKFEALAAFLEQHMVYPLPEEYYQGSQTAISKNPLRIIFEDSKEKREERRKTFLTDWLPRLQPDENNRTQLVEKLTAIDQEITGIQKDDVRINQLLGERAKELESSLQDIFHGKHIVDEKHRVMLEKYKEIAGDLTAPLPFYINSLLYLNRVGSYVKKGMGKVVEELIDTARTKNINMKIQFTLLERDTILPLMKVDTLSNMVSSGLVGVALEGINFAQQYAHASVGYYSEILSELFTNPLREDE